MVITLIIIQSRVLYFHIRERLPAPGAVTHVLYLFIVCKWGCSLHYCMLMTQQITFFLPLTMCTLGSNHTCYLLVNRAVCLRPAFMSLPLCHHSSHAITTWFCISSLSIGCCTITWSERHHGFYALQIPLVQCKKISCPCRPCACRDIEAIALPCALETSWFPCFADFVSTTCFCM